MENSTPLLFPFIYLIKKIFLFSYNITGNYGVSLILLSFSVSLLLLPIFILIEKVKKKNDAVKLKMKPLVDEIKRCYKGQERYYYLKTINRQHKYSPLKALIPILSLLLQIPFFIAAYKYLEQFEPLHGVHFLFLKDLSSPDGLLGVINVLPIVMTLINLLTAYFYSRVSNFSERIQLLAIALLFLVLLFNLPSGLVLYWTMNNVFSFFRLFITNPEVFKRKERNNEYSEFRQRFIEMIPKLIGTFLIVTTILFLIQFNWAFQHSFCQIGLRLIASTGAALLITLLFSGISLLHRVGDYKPIKGLKNYYKRYASAFKPMLIIIGVIAVLSQLTWAIQFDFDDIVMRMVTALAASVLLTIVLAFLVLYYQGHISPEIINYNFKITHFGYKYLLVFGFLFSAAAYSQINWAFLFSNFKTIIPRLLISFLITWLITLLVAKLVNYLGKRKDVNIHELICCLKLIKKNLIITFLIAFTIATVTQINWAMHFTWDGIVWRMIISIIASLIFAFLTGAVYWFSKIFNWTFQWISEKPEIYLSLFFLGLYFHLGSLFFYSGFSIKLSYLANGCLLPALIVGFINFNRKRQKIRAAIWYSVFVLIIILFAFQLYNLWASSYRKDLIIDIFRLKSQLGEPAMAHYTNSSILISLILLFFYIRKSERKEKQISKYNSLIYLFAVLYLAGFIFLWNPLITYSTFPDNFIFPAIEILKHNIGLFAICTGGLLLFYIILPGKFKPFFLLFVLILAIIGFIHNTLLPIDMGTLQQSRFVDQDNLAQPLYIYILEAFSILGIVFLLQWLHKKNYSKQISLALIILNLALISESLFASVGTGSFLKKPNILTESDRSISFSRNNENVIFLLTDMFHGWYIDQILKENPELKDVFKGFVWYPNTLSISYITAGSLPPLIGGYNNTIDKLNQDENRTFEDKMTDVSIDFYNKIKSNNFRFTSTNIIYSKIDKNKFDSYLPEWDKSWDKWNSELKIGLSREIGYTLLWENAAFYTSPLFLKPKIYKKGNWLHGDVTSNENTNEAKPYNFLRLLPYISHTRDEKPNFIFIYAKASHHPWDIIDEEGRLHNFDTPYKNNEWVLKTLAKWINWMKANDVYDNTKIIIVSDHGPHWRNNYARNMAGNMPITDNPSLKIPEIRYMGMFPLLMTKDFNQKEDFKVDNKFMSNVDAYYFAFNEKSPIAVDDSGQQELPFTIVYWESDLWLKSKLNIVARGKVKENVFDLNNWILIPEKH